MNRLSLPDLRIGMHISAATLIVVCLSLLFLAEARSDEPLLVTYGLKAPVHEGDPDHRQLVRFTVPKAYRGKLFVRVFDADTEGRYDEQFGIFDTRTRFAVYSASSEFEAGLSRDQDGFLKEQPAGHMLAETTIGGDADYDDKWVTLFEIDTGSTAPNGGDRAFFLLIEGIRGDDGNLFDVAVSTRTDENISPAKLRLFSLMPTVRVPDEDRLTELRFRTPAGSQTLNIGSFDTSKGLVFLSNRFRSIPLNSGQQGEWVNSRISLHKSEKDAVSAITFGGGREIPNDITFYVADSDGRPLPINLPPRSVRPNNRPRLALKMMAQTCRVMKFDALGSTDPEGTNLSYRWIFHDGEERSSGVAVREYDEPGTYDARLEIFDGSGVVGNGSARDFKVLVKAPPVAGFDAPDMVAAGESVRFDASESSIPKDPAGLAISRYAWRFENGSVQSLDGSGGALINHRFNKPGTYKVTLTVTDSSGHVCSTDSVSKTIIVNAPPQADAGADLRLADGEQAVMDASALGDADGDPVTYRWDMGDGTILSGAKISHRYGRSGSYIVTLTANDGRGASNSIQTDTASVFVNAPPVVNASMPEALLTGEVFDFDASRSLDSDGAVSAVEWDFGDGRTIRRKSIRKAFFEAGTYDVAVTVRDDSGLSNAAVTERRIVVVSDPKNLPPSAVIGGANNGVVDNLMVFDGSASSDPDGSILRFDWDFGDGQKRSGMKTSHVYRTAGSYKLRLRVTDNSGKPNAWSESEFDVVVAERSNRPAAIQVYAKSEALVDEVIIFDAGASTDPDGNILFYNWQFGDGTTGTGPVMSHSYGKPGKYAVKLTILDDSNLGNKISETEFDVLVRHPENRPPVAEMETSFVAETEQELLFDASKFSDPEGRVIGYRWEFGDGHVSDQAVVRHAYARPGDYSGRLIMRDGSGLDSGTSETPFSVVVSQRANIAPTAVAGADQSSRVAQVVSFDGGGSSDSDGSLIRYEWDFGNGKTAEGQAARIAYFEPGTYTVKLKVTDNSAQSNATASDTLEVTVSDQPNSSPVAVMQPDRPAAIGEIVTFSGRESDDNDGNIISYDWRFGDGGTASGIEVTHAYRSAGEYVATLTVADDSGLSNSKTVALRTIRVNQPPVADAGSDQRVTASVVDFSASASRDDDGKIIRYEWDFGDGETGEGETISHTYREPGTYKVGLRVTDDSGSISDKDEDHLAVTVNDLPIADSGPDIVAAPGEEILFDGSRSLDPDGSIERYEWDFRDGASGFGQQVTHVFKKPGTYFVQLKVTDDTGHDNATDHSQTEVVVNARPIANAGRDILIAPGETVTLDGQGSTDIDGEIGSWIWSFSDDDQPVREMRTTRVFDKPGEYTAVLTVTDDSSAANNTDQDELKIVVNHGPKAVAGKDQFSERLRIVLDGRASADADNDGLSYVWDLGDGNSKTGPLVEHIYENGGVYPVVLTIDDGKGLANSVDRDSLKVFINRPPEAVAGDDKDVCVGDIVVFDGSKSKDPDNGLIRHSWEFGDGTVSDIFNPTKTFEAPGTYRVLLTVRDDSGLANDTHRNEMLVTVNPAPVANAGKDILACANTEVQFDGSKSTDIDGVVNRFSWDFGDGGSGGGDRPKHVFTQAGTYRVNLLIEGDNRGLCSPSSSDEVLVNIINAPRGVISAVGQAALGETVEFDAARSYADAGEITEYEWDFGDGETANGVTASHAYSKPGTYRVSLSVKADGIAEQCRSVTSHHIIRINDAPIADAGEDRVVEVNQALTLSGAASTDPDGGLSIYHWDFGDGTTAGGIETTHTWREPGVYDVTLTVTDNTDLSNNTAKDRIRVEVKAAPQATIETAGVACVQQPVEFDLKNLTDAADKDRIRWAFGDGERKIGATASHSYSRPGTYTVSISGPVLRATEVVESFASRTIKINRPPLAAAGNDRKTCAATELVFDAAQSHDFDGKITSFDWDFGDGVVATGAEVRHSYAKPGTYRVRLSVTDDSGSSCATTTDELEVFVNAPPVADAGPDQEAWIGGARDRFTLDGSRSHDPDGDALVYFWTLPDGEELDGEKAGHVFSRAGKVTIKLETADIHDLSCSVSSDEMIVNVRSRHQQSN